MYLEEHQIKVQLYLQFNPTIQFNSLLPILKIKIYPGKRILLIKFTKVILINFFIFIIIKHNFIISIIWKMYLLSSTHLVNYVNLINRKSIEYANF